MAGYLGSKQLFRNYYAGKPIREIYNGNAKIMGFNTASYATNEIVTATINSVEGHPVVSANGTAIMVSTNNYASGYAYTRYYCDHMKITMMYSGNMLFYDCDGNVVVDINCGVSWSNLSGKYTLTCVAYLLGVKVLDTSSSDSSIPAGKVTIEVYYDLTNKRWVMLRDGSTYVSSSTEWKPTYACVMPKMWFLISTYSSMFFDGTVTIQYMNKGVGYPQAKS